jgi:hypothetical protein
MKMHDKVLVYTVLFILSGAILVWGILAQMRGATASLLLVGWAAVCGAFTLLLRCPHCRKRISHPTQILWDGSHSCRHCGEDY